MRIAPLLFVVVVLVACGDPPSGPNPETDLVRTSCRLYPRRVRENATTEYTCELRTDSSAGLSCRNGPSSRGWSYASVEDFVREVETPNKFRRLSSTTAFSSMLNSSSSTRVAYDYDSQGRLSGRLRTGSNVIGPFTYDTTTFLTWDGRGRPLTARIVTPAGGETLVTISYDDAAREVLWSDGERHRMDRHGNTLSETWILRGAPFAREYEILETAEVCLP